MLLLAAVILTLSPWKGPSLPTVVDDAAKYKLTVRGAANQNVHLQARGLPEGWIAAFCTKEYCSPNRYTMHLDAHGTGMIEFQAIRLEDSALKLVRVTVRADDGATAQARIKATRKTGCEPSPKRFCSVARVPA